MARADSTAHLAALDGLRGIAILMVVWFHIWQLSWLGSFQHPLGPWLDYQFIPETGYLGVELFFFISGFCLFYPYARAALEARPAPASGHFAYRRFIKIVPSYLFALIVLTVLERRQFGSWRDLAWQLGSHLSFIHPWFAGTYESIDGVLWSLGVEVQFYVLFLPIAWIFRRSPRSAFATFAVMCAVAIAYRGFVMPLNSPYSSQLINNLPGVIDLFASGMLAAYVVVFARRRWGSGRLTAPVATLAALIGFAGLVGLLRAAHAAGYDNSITHWQAQNRTWLAVDFIVLAAGSCLAIPRWQAMLANPVLVYLSLVSYNLYIWHQLIARWMFDRRFPNAATADPHDDPHWQILFTLAAAAAGLVVATAITFGLERPLLRRKPRGFAS